MDNSTPDLSKIISLIMENPKLINDIKALAGNSDETSGDPTPSMPYEDSSASEKEVKSVSTVSETPPQNVEGQVQKNRKKLLTAFKPYLSGERSRAIDSMLSIADIIDAMKAR